MSLLSLFVVGGLTVESGHAETRPDPINHQLVSDAAREPAWLKLLHYSQPLFEMGAAQSDVLDTGFFLAADGKVDAEAELFATIRAMEAPIGADPNDHAQCRFPARFIWLKKTVWKNQSAPANVECPNFRTWLGDDPITGASFIFVSGYLQNPSSFYGHMMLRLNTGHEDRLDKDQLLAKALNHGAIFPNNENGVAYIFNGLTGGYPATFSELEFFHHEHEWNEEELRDAWEYELELTDDQVAMLAAHSWEMRQTHVPYYFLRQNCAFRMAEMVSVVIDGTLIPPTKPWVMPIDILASAKQFQNGDTSLVRSTRLLPSRQSTFRERFEELSSTEQRLVKNYIAAPTNKPESSLVQVEGHRRAAVVETLIDYFNMDQSQAELSAEAKVIRNDLLLARMQMPPGMTPVDYDRHDPEKGNKPSLAQVSAIQNTELGNLTELRLRGAYNDFMTRAPGSMAYSELTMGDIRVNISEDEVYLKGVEVLRITTLGLSETGLPEDEGMAWRLRFGAEQDRLDCTDCLTGYVEGGVGKAVQLSKGLVAFGLLGGRIVGPDQDDGVAHVGVSGGVVTDPWQSVRFAAEGGAWHDLDGDGETRTFAQIEARVGDAPDWDISLGVKFEKTNYASTTEYRASLSYYW